MRFKLPLFVNAFLLFGAAAFAQKGKVFIFKFDSITNNPINCEACSIKVDTTMHVSALFKKTVTFDEAVFTSGISFPYNVTFNDAVSFQGATFSAAVNFESPVFQNEVSFEEATFAGQTIFHTINFAKKASFDNTTFKNSVAFEENFFKGPATFGDAVFKKGADFERSTFYAGANLSGTKFNGDINFHYVTFKGAADFSGTGLNGHVNFNTTEFTNFLSLKNISTSDSTVFNFNSAVLPELIDLSNDPTLKHTIDLTTHLVEGRSAKSAMAGPQYTYVSLYNTDISKVKIDYQNFRLCFFGSNVEPFELTEARDGLFFEGLKGEYFHFDDTTTYKRMLATPYVQNYLKQIFPTCKITDTVVIHFLKSCVETRYFPGPLSKDQIQAIYEQVLKNFKDNGQNDSYEALDVEYKDYKNGWFILPHIWNCYGYRREWVFYWALAFLLLFTTITYFLIDTLNDTEEQGGVYHMDNLKTENLKDIWYNRLWYSFMYTSTLFFVLKVDVSKLNFKKKWGVFYIILIYSFGVLCLGYMANFVLQK